MQKDFGLFFAVSILLVMVGEVVPNKPRFFLIKGMPIVKEGEDILVKKITVLNGKKKSVDAGFTLIEIIVVIGIIGVLAAIAIPAYNGYIKRSRKVEAKTNLSALSILVEEYNSLYGRYCPACTDNAAHAYQYIENNAGVATTDTVTNWLDFKPKQAASGAAVVHNYTISATSNTAYTLTAAPVVGRGVDNDTLTIDEAGAKTTTDNDTAVTSGGW